MSLICFQLPNDLSGRIPSLSHVENPWEIDGFVTVIQSGSGFVCLRVRSAFVLQPRIENVLQHEHFNIFNAA